MKKTMASLALALLFLTASVALVGAQSPTGVILGQVVNGTAGGSPPGAVGVSVQGFKGTEALSVQTVQTDADGWFRVEGLDTGEDVMYVLSTEYLGIQYASDVLAFEQGASELQTTLPVYETTTSDAAISLSRIHYVIDFLDGAMDVTEVHSFSNSGDRTYIGAEPAAGEARTTVNFVLPVDATELIYEESMFAGRFVETPGGFADTEPIVPGQGTLQTAFSYVLPYDGSPRVISTTLPYAAANVNAFVADIGPELLSEQLSYMGTMGAGTRSFIAYVGQGFAKGDIVALEISGDVQESAAASSSEEGGGSNVAYVFIVGALALFLVALAFAYPSLRRKERAEPVAAPPVTTEDEWEELLAAIADLDDTFEAGQLNEEVYHTRRQALKARLLELERLGGE